MLEGSSAYYPDGVIDVGVIVVSLFENPLRGEAVRFLSDVLLQRKRATIPLTAVLGAYHIAVRYLRLPAVEVKSMLVGMLKTRSPAFYPYVFLDDVIEAVEYATHYRIESWDGYLVRLSKSIGNNIVYTLDEELRRVKDLVVINPFPEDLVRQYHEYIKRKMYKKITR
jgi:predicted nucleic acid-binding protein